VTTPAPNVSLAPAGAFADAKGLPVRGARPSAEPSASLLPVASE
jgi:hypothetical protein